ncbi:MAG: HAMP domain-containing histidine kinase [Microbacteriaceae bacterium]|nr:MAG: HAMP domain-containing histidine kinase [Microbacteriaceae bacterium]
MAAQRATFGSGPRVRGRSRLRVPGGIRARVTASAALVVALTLIIAGVALTFLVRQSLVDGVDNVLGSRADQVAAQSVGPTGIRGTIPATAQQSSLVQILDANGTVIAATANMRDDDDNQKFKDPVLDSPPTSRRTTISTLTDSPLDRAGSFRVVAKPVTLQHGPGWVYVATSLSPVDAAAGTVITMFAIGLPLVLFIVAVTVWWAVTHAFKPVEGIRRQASSISAANLTQRVPVPHSRDEIERLATTMNQMLDRLEGAATRQNQFIGDASHELRSPLAALRAQVEVALAHPDQTESVQLLTLVRDQISRMTMLTEDLLFLARSTEPGGMILPAPVDLDELVLAEVRRLRKAGGHTITVVALDAARVTGSQRDLTRALRNLTDNARGHAHSEVRLSLRTNNGVAEITISDDGDGIPEADRDRLFERFARLEESRARNITGSGFGLGLAIARQITLAHGGTLTAHDRADGHPGAEFLLRIPMAPTLPE